MADRIACSVPFCPRTIKGGQYREWICGIHWSLVSSSARRFKRQAGAAYRAATVKCEAIDAEAVADMREHKRPGLAPEIYERFRVAADRRDKKARQSNRAWERCKRQAIERAAGI
jgi:hypothetical protein